MGLKPQLLPDSFLSKMSKTDLAPLKHAGLTMAEAQSKADTRREKELQRDMESLLRQRNLWFVRSRMDRRSTVFPKGCPDYLIFFRGTLAVAVEAKVHGGRFSEDQLKVQEDFYEKTGNQVRIVTNLQSFRELLDQHQKL